MDQQSINPLDTPVEVENRHHRYVGSRIPWYIHLLWLSFWVFAVSYVVIYLFPAIKTAFVSPP